MTLPKLIKGNKKNDNRGCVYFNNDFNLNVIKRIYFITNIDTKYKRGWQGHKIEQRWFCAISGIFEIQLIKIDDWDNPSKKIEKFIFQLNEDEFDVLHVPKGYVSCIRALKLGSKLQVMSDYSLGEVNDEYRFESDYFDI